MIKTFLEKQQKYSAIDFDISRVLIAVPSIKHRHEMTISVFNGFPNRIIFGEAEEREIYDDYISAGWTFIDQQYPKHIGRIRNQILEYFKAHPEFDYCFIVDDEVIWRRVITDNDSFFTVKTMDIHNELVNEFARMVEEKIDVLTVPNSQFLSSTMGKALTGKPAVDYCAIAFSRRVVDMNYWYIDFTGHSSDLKICEDKVMARMLLANDNIKCSSSIFLRRECQAENKGNSTFGDMDNHRAAMSGADDVLERMSQTGLTQELKESLWTKEHFPTERIVIKFKRRKNYLAETNDEQQKWNKFIK